MNTLLLFLSVLLLQNTSDSVPLLKWMGPEIKPISRFELYMNNNTYSEFHLKHIDIEKNNPKGPAFAVFVEDSLYNKIASQISTYIHDLSNEGYNVTLYTGNTGNPAGIKNSIKQLYTDSLIEGVILIGTFAAPFFQTDNDFNEGTYDDWACDLYYMDMDGTWDDTLQNSSGTLIPGKDNIFDTHYGDVGPEIYVSRIYPNIGANDSLIVTNLLSRIHQYRVLTTANYHRALFFIDDDWIPWASTWSSDLKLVYDSVGIYSAAEETRADTYSLALDSVYEWVSLFAHSWPGGHAFYYNNKVNTDYFYATEYTSKNPSAHFYNFFCCSFADYTTSGYGAGRALFADSGFVSIGSTKTGSMLQFNDFYSPISNGSTIGEAFMLWFEAIAGGGFSQSELSWHYGMTLLGDPTLIPNMTVTGIEDITYTYDDNHDNPLLMHLGDLKGINIRICYDCCGRRVHEITEPGIYFIVKDLNKYKITVIK